MDRFLPRSFSDETEQPSDRQGSRRNGHWPGPDSITESLTGIKRDLRTINDSPVLIENNTRLPLFGYINCSKNKPNVDSTGFFLYHNQYIDWIHASRISAVRNQYMEIPAAAIAYIYMDRSKSACCWYHATLLSEERKILGPYFCGKHQQQIFLTLNLARFS